MQESRENISGGTPGKPLTSDIQDVDLPALPAVPGMTSASQCRYLYWLYWLASSQLTGSGQLIEIGSWLGPSSLHLAAGIERSGQPAKLRCFDCFTWAPSVPDKSDLPLRPDDSFQRYFEQMRDWARGRRAAG